MIYNTVEDYIRAYGYQVSDLTPEELAQVTEEFEVIRNGGDVLDGFFSPLSDFSLRMLQEGR